MTAEFVAEHKYRRRQILKLRFLELRTAAGLGASLAGIVMGARELLAVRAERRQLEQVDAELVPSPAAQTPHPAPAEEYRGNTTDLGPLADVGASAPYVHTPAPGGAEIVAQALADAGIEMPLPVERPVEAEPHDPLERCDHLADLLGDGYTVRMAEDGIHAWVRLHGTVVGSLDSIAQYDDEGLHRYAEALAESLAARADGDGGD